MIGIIAAMQLELEGIKQSLEDVSSRVISGREYFCGSINGREVVCAVCGIGKVNAAICAQTMILNYSPDCIINTGVGGALDKNLKVCDVVCATYAVQHDMDTSALGDEPGFVSTVNVLRFPMDDRLADELVKAMEESGVSPVRAAIATGDKFVCRTEDKEYISKQFGCSVCEMEGAAIAHACYLNNIPCAVLRAISDGADEGSPMSYQDFADMAAKRSVKVLLRFIANR